ncbi:MAG: hypothetical protein R3F56_02550 [Planctomycetota bacterium]
MLLHLRLLATGALLAGATVGHAAGQSASYTFFGSACSGGGPPFSVVGTPRLGGSFTLVTQTSVRRTRYETNDDVFILTGASTPGLDLRGLNLPGISACGFLLASTELILVAPATTLDPQPYSIVFPIPNVASLLGGTFHQQVLLLSRAISFPPHSLLASRGGRGVIGR